MAATAMAAGKEGTPGRAPSRRLAGVILGVVSGPLALAGFFLPWAKGPGVLAGSEFSGYGLVGFAGRLQQLDLTPAEGGLLAAGRLAILLVAVAAVWLALLSPWARRHPLRRAAGWYMVGFALIAAGIGLAAGGPGLPASGLGLVFVAALAFAAGELLAREA